MSVTLTAMFARSETLVSQVRILSGRPILAYSSVRQNAWLWPMMPLVRIQLRPFHIPKFPGKQKENGREEDQRITRVVHEYHANHSAERAVAFGNSTWVPVSDHAELSGVIWHLAHRQGQGLHDRLERICPQELSVWSGEGHWCAEDDCLVLADRADSGKASCCWQLFHVSWAQEGSEG